MGREGRTSPTARSPALPDCSAKEARRWFCSSSRSRRKHPELMLAGRAVSSRCACLQPIRQLLPCEGGGDAASKALSPSVTKRHPPPLLWLPAGAGTAARHRHAADGIWHPLRESTVGCFALPPGFWLCLPMGEAFARILHLLK